MKIEKYGRNRFFKYVLIFVLIFTSVTQVKGQTLTYTQMFEPEQDSVTVEPDNEAEQDELQESQSDTEDIPDSVRPESEQPEINGSPLKDAVNEIQGDESEEPEESLPDEEDEESEEPESELLFSPVETDGVQLYRGEGLDSSNHLGTYTNWAGVSNAIKSDIAANGTGAYSIDVRNTDLALGNWKTDFNTDASTGNAQNFLHFYSTTYDGNEGTGSVTLAAASVMGAHVQFHEGVRLNTPTSSGAGSSPLDPLITSAQSVYRYNYGEIYANGWRFIVDKGVDVHGYAILYATGTTGTSTLASARFYFNTDKTVLEDEGGIQAGYLEVNAGQWRIISGYNYHATGAYRIKVGTDDDPANPVRVDAVLGTTRSGGQWQPLTPDPDIATESIEVSGNTIVKFGVAIMFGGGKTYTDTSGSESAGRIYYSTQKVKLSKNVTVQGTLGGVTVQQLEGLSNSYKNSYNRVSVSAGASSNGYEHYNNGLTSARNGIVNIIVEISDNVFIAGDVIGNGPNMYFNVNNQSKGVHISIKGQAKIGGNVVYGGSSSAKTVTPNDSIENPFFTMHVEGETPENGIKIGGHLLATNGEDNSSDSSWNVSTKVINATVNGSVFGYGNLGNQATTTGMSIKNAEIIVENSYVGGGVYGVATGNTSDLRERGSTENCSIIIKNSTVGHVVPFFRMATQGGKGHSTSRPNPYPIGTSNITIEDSDITGRTVMWISPGSSIEASVLTYYAFIVLDENGNYTDYLKAMADIQFTEDGTRTIEYTTDGYNGIPLEPTRPDISLTTSMRQQNTVGMRLYSYQIVLQKSNDFPGIHKVSITNTNFTRTNGNPFITIADTGDGSLGTSADIVVDNCYATDPGKKLDVFVFGELTGTVDTNKVENMTMTARNSNALGNIGFAKKSSSASNYINTNANITLENTVTDSLFAVLDSDQPIRSLKNDNVRVQFVFKENNTIDKVFANRADIVFEEDSVTYVKGQFNNTSATVYDNEWVGAYEGSRVYLGNEGDAADKDNLGDAQSQRVFGSIHGRNGEMYIYKDTSDMDNYPNKTYPIYVAQTGKVLSTGMNLGLWTSDDGTIATANKDTLLNADTGSGITFEVIEPSISKNEFGLQREHDVLMAFGTEANADPDALNDVPLRPWPIIRYMNENGSTKGWLVLGKPRYQIIYQGSGYIEGTDKEVVGKAEFDSYSEDSITRPGIDDYQYTDDDDPYHIEAVMAVPENPGYEFLYWKLFSTAEREDEEGDLIRNDWVAKSEIINDNPPLQSELPEVNIPEDGNIWIQNNQIDLMEFLTNEKLPKSESKVLMLVPIYKANYVCKIGDEGYLSLAEAFAAIEDGTADSQADGSYKIEMIVEEYEIKTKSVISSGRNIIITTASPDDLNLPYQGEAGTHCILKRGYIDEEQTSPYTDEFFNVQGGTSRLTLMNILLDGNRELITSHKALIELGDAAKLSLLSGSVLINNCSDNGAAAVQGSNNNVITLENTKITDNISSQSGGALVSGEQSDIRLKGTVIVSGNRRMSGVDEEAANICLEEDGRLYIEGSLSTESIVGVRVAPVNHIYGYVLADAFNAQTAKESYPYIKDDYEESLEITVNPENLTQIQFVATKQFKFIKVTAEDTQKALNGVEFKLYLLTCQDEEHDHSVDTDLVNEDGITQQCWREIADDISGGEDKEDGLVDMGHLVKGTYMLVEHSTVIGYQLPLGQWLIEIDPSQQQGITIDARGSNDMMPPAFMTETDGNDEVTYKLPNIKLLQIPLAGMPGIYKFLLTGGTILSLTTLLFFLRKRRNNKLLSR